MTTQNKILIGLGVPLVLLLGTILTIRILSGEDGWICVNNQWVSHGHLKAPAPTSGCERVVEPPIQDTVPTSTPTTTDEEYYQRIMSKLRNESGQETRLYSPDMSDKGTANDWKSPMLVKGALPSSWYFEATAHAVLKDGNNKVLADGSITSQGDWTKPGLVPFETTFTFSTPTTPIGTLTLFADNPSGMPENERWESYQVKLWPEVKVYFSDLNRDPDMKECGQVYYNERFVPPTPAIARAALEELLKGPIKTDKFERNMITNINPGVKIQKLTIVNGVAKVDFDAELEKGVGGSCKTAAIRAQIEQTLKQFPTVQSVVISIDDRVQDILQP